MRSLFVLLLAAVISGCDVDSFLIDNLLVDTTSKALPTDVKLHPGQSVLLPHEGYTITFERVTQDSRCPIGVECIWAGDGAAKLEVKDKTGAVREDTLHTTLNPQSVQLQQINIRLKTLDPYPVYDVPRDTSKYVVTLRISRAENDSL